MSVPVLFCFRNTYWQGCHERNGRSWLQLPPAHQTADARGKKVGCCHKVRVVLFRNSVIRLNKTFPKAQSTADCGFVSPGMLAGLRTALLPHKHAATNHKLYSRPESL